ncbi:MAG: hypothetical protein ABW040_07430, partial [Microbacteriaceae bacterium]
DYYVEDPSTYRPAWWLTVTVPAVGGVSVQTYGGVEVGTPTAEIEALLPTDVPFSDQTDNVFLGSIPTGEPNTTGGEISNQVWGLVSDDVITEFRAPSPDCCGV